MFKDDPLAFLEAKHALLSSINAYTDINKTISQFAKTCTDTLALTSAYIYSLELIQENPAIENGQITSVKILSRTTVLKLKNSNTPDKQVLKHIVNRFMNSKDPLKLSFDNSHYFGFILRECNKLLIFDSKNNIDADQISELFEQPIEKLDRLARVIGKASLVEITDSESEPEANINHLHSSPHLKHHAIEIILR